MAEILRVAERIRLQGYAGLKVGETVLLCKSFATRDCM
jgi:hypothetical protein